MSFESTVCTWTDPPPPSPEEDGLRARNKGADWTTFYRAFAEAWSPHQVPATIWKADPGKHRKLSRALIEAACLWSPLPTPFKSSLFSLKNLKLIYILKCIRACDAAWELALRFTTWILGLDLRLSASAASPPALLLFHL